MKQSIYIGFDKRHAAPHAVCRSSIERRLSRPIPIHGVVLDDLRDRGLYWRSTSERDLGNGRSQLFDDISDAPMSTEFAISRFFTPYLAGTGWALFMDCDIVSRVNLVKLFALADPRYAVMCVKHRHEPPEGVKMDGQIQALYQRKNWSSVMLFNVNHPANAALTIDMLNGVPGRDLHRFCWLDDHLIGELPAKWNHLVGTTKVEGIEDAENPALIHWTDGYPLLPGYETADYHAVFFRELTAWAK